MTVRILTLALSVVIATALTAAPAPVPSPATATPEDLADAADVTGTASPWDISTTLRASSGWRENVTVSGIRPLNRAFGRAEVESFFLRPLGTRWHLVGFLNADVLRYIDPPEDVSGEQQWIGNLEVRWLPVSSVRVSLKGVGFLADTFIDPAESEGSQVPATWVRLLGGYSTLGARISLPWGLAVEPSVQVKQMDYQRGYPGDYSATRPGLRLEWKRGDRFAVSVAAFQHRRHYKHLAAYRSGSRLFTDRLMGLEQREAELKLSTAFGRRNAWTLAASTGWLENRDRAVGVLDYDEQRARLEAGWEQGRWRINVTGEARHLEYRLDYQWVGQGTSRTPRIADVYDLAGRVEYDLDDHWTLFADERWERNRSNIKDAPPYRFSYRTLTAQAGVQYEF